MSTEFAVLADGDAVAEAIAERLITALTAVQRDHPERNAQLALTGGRIATRAYQRLAVDGPGSAVDWSRVELWWGDERFVAADSEDRNDRGALESLIPALPLVEANIHRMPADDGSVDLDAAAAAYADELGDISFDICLLGMGPDGHVASVFPDHPSFQGSLAASTDVIAVRDSPKPPPLRISLTHPAINRSAAVWFTVSGADKADAVGWATSGSKNVPAGHAQGTEETLWLLDQEAAARLPG
ncbi:6-phosphogluconolactonase [Microlunatus soli]|uniref:6-phosphogluconolactonase n=1 Tax=Microlunatus soli TaxID=630515 RepID=A0A1H1P5M6_9ACTN|nr:6-phosphogluconolactonase [Microlunatus soli]SDS06502.1 6-phosphogluconolactonase [Microlunatus soli]